MSLVTRFAILLLPTIDRNKPTMCTHLYNDVIVSTPACHAITNSMLVTCKLCSIGTTTGPASFMFLYMKNKDALKQTFPQHNTRIDSEANAVLSISMVNGCHTTHPTPFLSG